MAESKFTHAPARKHGHGAHGSQSLTHKSWLGMKVRCTYPYTSGYKYYGGRGIGFDPRWKKFETFLADMGERPSELHDLSRLDHDKDYSKENCIWEPRSSNRNTRARSLIGQSTRLIIGETDGSSPSGPTTDKKVPTARVGAFLPRKMFHVKQRVAAQFRAMNESSQSIMSTFMHLLHLL